MSEIEDANVIHTDTESEIESENESEHESEHESEKEIDEVRLVIKVECVFPMVIRYEFRVD